MPHKSAFRPPIDSPLIEAATRACVPLLLKGMFGDLRVQFLPEDLERLAALRGERMLLLPNHPSTEDPIILFELARRLKEPMYYVAAREVFDFDHGVRGWLFQRCGVYSVIRGAPDRESFRATRQILTLGTRRLVVFIEGEISYRNDVLIPFQQGVLQLALAAQEDVCERFADAPPPVYAVPVAIRYHYTPGVTEAIIQSLQRLEEAVGLPDNDAPDAFSQIQRIGERIVSIQEGLLRLSGDGLSMNERVAQLKNKLLEKMERFLELPPPSAEQGVLDRVRALRNRLDRILYAYDDPEGLSPYEREITRGMSRTFAEFYEDLDRVVNFMTYRQEDFTPESPPERWVEMVHRLEKEAFGERRLTHPRTAHVHIGDCQDLRTRMSAYRAARKQTVAALSATLESNMRALLQSVD